MDLNDRVDMLIQSQAKQTDADALVSEIHPDIFFKYNSVNLVIARRGAGKTHLILREILKCVMLRECKYTQLWYCTDKENDDTFNKISPLLENYLEVHWIKTSEALQLIKALELGKSELDNPEYRKALNANSEEMPHTFILFDDCVYLFSKPSELTKKLFQNRQSRTTIFLMLQDVQGISPSAKANVDSLVLFGGFPPHKFNVLMYQMPAIENADFETYKTLTPQDYMLIDYVDSTCELVYRD